MLGKALTSPYLSKLRSVPGTLRSREPMSELMSVLGTTV